MRMERVYILLDFGGEGSFESVVLKKHWIGEKKNQILRPTQNLELQNLTLILLLNNSRTIPPTFFAQYLFNNLSSGDLELLNKGVISTQPLTGLDWHADKRGLGLVSALDQCVRVFVTTNLECY